MIISVTLNPAVDKTVTVDELVVNGLNRLDNVITNAGGKGINVSKTLHHLGGTSIATGFSAGSNGSYIKNVLDEYGIHHDMVNVMGNTRVNLKVLDAQMNLTELNEIGPTISEDDVEGLKNKLESIVKKGDIVVFSGSAPKGVKTTIYCELSKFVKTKGARAIIDADKDLFVEGLAAVPTLIKPNKFELCQFFNEDESIEDSVIVEKAQEFLRQGIEFVVISMGSKGAYFLSNEGVYHVEGLKIKAHSSVGAGDAMVAALSYALDNNYSMEDMITLSVACSAGAVETQGTQPATLDRINELKQQVKIKKVK